MIPFREQIIGFLGSRVDTKGYFDFRQHLEEEVQQKRLKAGIWWWMYALHIILCWEGLR